MKTKRLLAAVSATMFLVVHGEATAGTSVEQVGAFACVTDKWEETEPEKGHKLADGAMRCVIVPDDPAAPKLTQECVAKHESKPDGSWKLTGTCTDTFKGGDKRYETLEEGSHLEEFIYKFDGGTGKYEGASGGGTYTYENLTDTLSGGRYKGRMELP